MGSVRIFICCPGVTSLPSIDNEVCMPLLYGAALQRVPAGCIGDCSGSNLSLQAWKYGALTAWYWVLKNYLPQAREDYVGLFTHHHILNLNAAAHAPGSHAPTLKATGIYWRYGFDLQLRSWTCASIMSRLDGCDMALPMLRGRDNCTTLAAFAHLHHEHELQRTLEIMRRACPDYLSYAESFLAGTTEYMHNCLIMKRELLTAYLSWIFELLSALEPGSRWHEYPQPQAAGLPFNIMSRMFNVWLAHRAEHQPLRIIELPYFRLLHDTDGKILTKIQMQPILNMGNARCDPHTYKVLSEVFNSMDPDRKTYLCVKRLRCNPRQSGLLLALMRSEPDQPTLRKVMLMLQTAS